MRQPVNSTPKLSLKRSARKSQAKNPMKVEELLRCQIQEWYPNFQPYTFRTIILPIPPPFLHYLLDDSGPFLLPTTTPEDPPSSSSFSSSSPPPPSFPGFDSEVSSAISSLGGSAFPKLNWSSPKDAASFSFSSSLESRSLSDLSLLLKSSDSALHDLLYALPSCSDYRPNSTPPISFHLALRRFYPHLRPDMEFRCFVRRRSLLAVSQRDVTSFYPSLLELRAEIGILLGRFCEEVVLPWFESEDFTFDAYVTKHRRVKLVDFNPWGVYTLPLLFEWEELEERNGDGEVVEVRVVECRMGVRPGIKTVVPYDYVDTGEGSGWDAVFRMAEEEFRRQARSEAESEEDQ